MKKLLYLCVILLATTCALDIARKTEAQTPNGTQVSPNIVISQLQAGTAADANDEFVELHNNGLTPVDLNGYRVVYRSQNGTNDVGPLFVWTASTIIQPGQYYLLASNSHTGGPSPDGVWNTSACACSLSASANGGGLAIRLGSSNTGTIIDSVGWAGAANAFVEGAAGPNPGNTNSLARKLNGCQDTDNNSNDFSVLTPPAPRNAATTPTPCSGGGTTLFAALAANPTAVSVGGTTLLTVTVVPATDPPSTNITVTGNLSAIGGAASQQFFDDGSNGDATAGDNVYSYRATVPNGTGGGVYSITAVAADAQSRVVNLSQNITVNAPRIGEDPLLFGNPSGATADVANENNYLMVKPQYTLSYNRSKATPNWVAWRLDTSWLGSADRQDNYRADTSLPAGWYQVQDSDYSGSGFTRGHMCPSGDRTDSVDDNSATFLMTNFVPQTSQNNSGLWEDFESYVRSLTGAGKEVYIVAGPYGNAGTIASGKIVVPESVWKVVLVLDNGSDDLNRTWKNARAFGVIMPNTTTIPTSGGWRQYRVTVDAVERLTGYDFFNALPVNTQRLIESRHDIQ